MADRKSTVTAKLQDATREVLDKLDIEAEYVALGVEVAARQARATGWLSVRAMGREDRNASAEINVGDGPARGRYRDFGSPDGAGSLSLFDFAARYAPLYAGDWKEARKGYAKKVGVPLPAGDDERAMDKLELLGRTASMATWVSKKPGVTLEAVFAAGGQMARYPKGLRAELTQFVIAFPSYGSGLLDLDPIGYTLVAANGGKVRRWKGQGNEPDWLDKMTLGRPGMLNQAAMIGLAKAEQVWFVEGVTDMLALQAALPNDGKAIVTTCGACTYYPDTAWLEHFVGKEIFVCFDCDKPGQNGAAVWCSMLTGKANVRNVKLPFETVENHGRDLRDWLREVE